MTALRNQFNILYQLFARLAGNIYFHGTIGLAGNMLNLRLAGNMLKLRLAGNMLNFYIAKLSRFSYIALVPSREM